MQQVSGFVKYGFAMRVVPHGRKRFLLWGSVGRLVCR